MFCENCGTKMGENELFCSNCGEKVQNQQIEPINDENIIVEKQNHIKNNSSIRKNYKSVISGIVIISLIVSSVAFFNSLSTESEQVIYAKGTTLLSSDGKVKIPNVVSNSFYTEGIIDDVDAADKTKSISMLLNLGYQNSKDNKYIFYADNFNDGEKYSIFRAPKNNFDKRELIAKNATVMTNVNDTMLFQLVNNDTGIIYKNNSYNSAYFYSDFTTERKIINNGELIGVDPNGSTIIYLEYNDQIEGYSLYSMDLLNISEPAKLIEKGPVNNYFQFDKNKPLDVYYTIGDSEVTDNGIVLNQYKDGVVKEIFRNCESAIQSGNDGGVYVFVAKKQALDYRNIVEDNMFQADRNVYEPRQEDYTTKVLNDDYWFGSYYSDEVDWNAYNAEYNKYQEKAVRDDIRNYINQNRYEYTNYEVYYIKDGNSTLITDKCDNVGFQNYNGFIFSEIDYSNIGEINISDIYNDIDYYYSGDYSSELETKISEKISELSKQKIAYKGKICELSRNVGEESYLDIMNSSNTGNCMVLKSNGDGNSDIIELTLTNPEQIATEKLVDSDIVSSKVFDDGKTVIYYKENPDSDTYDVAELKIYKNGESNTIAYNATIGSCTFGKSGEIYFIADYKEENVGGSLMKSNNREVSVIAEDVMQYYTTQKGEVYYLANVDAKGNGTLFKKNKIDKDSAAVQVDTGVSGIRGVGPSLENTLTEVYEKMLNINIF